MKVLITGSDGFIAKNLRIALREQKIETVLWARQTSVDEIKAQLPSIDFVFHLAGVNRPQNTDEFQTGNVGLTETLCSVLKAFPKIPVAYSSSTQVQLDNPYGKSKLGAEAELEKLSKTNGNPLYVYRLPNVFGKWSRPNYNSAVATFCFNTLNDLPVTINDPSAPIRLVYVDDVVQSLVALLKSRPAAGPQTVSPVYETTVGAMYEEIRGFKESRKTLITDSVGVGFTRALYATYVSFMKPEQFTYQVPRYQDPRGVFSEMLKTKDSGQFSFFTAGVGITRGGHYHHTKTEKFLVLKGRAKYKFRHLITDERFEIDVDAKESRIVETIPGWSHDITNIGDDEMIVMLWANEIFDREKPDTIGYEV